MHLNNYLVTNGKYPIYHLLFTRGETFKSFSPSGSRMDGFRLTRMCNRDYDKKILKDKNSIFVW